MQLRSVSFDPGGPIPGACAFCVPAASGHVALGGNRSPHLAWSEVPAGTRSFALVCIDGDAPSVGDDVNREGRSVAADLPRADFHHWGLIDVPPELRELAEGACSADVTPGGKVEPAGPAGTRQAVNDYTGWFAGDAKMGGTYRGYDGPAPPWNDLRVHRYVFRVYALDVERLPLEGDFTVPQILAALTGHVLGEAELMGTYTLNPALR